jgi:hypothetical protein
MINRKRLVELILEPRWPLTDSQMESLEPYHSQKALNSVAGLINMMEDIAHEIAIENAAEIGCFHGVSTEVLAMYCQSLYAIDPWLEDDAACPDGLNSYESFSARMRNYDNVYTLRTKSPAVCEQFHFGLFDFVYLDGMHTYKEVVEDIQAWLPLVRSGGFLCGHDYVDYQDSWAAQWIQVKAAVDDTLGPPNKVYPDSSWLWRKP